MNRDRIPGDKTSAELVLNAEKSALLELYALIIEHKLNKTHEITGLISNLIEEIDEELE